MKYKVLFCIFIFSTISLYRCSHIESAVEDNPKAPTIPTIIIDNNTNSPDDSTISSPDAPLTFQGYELSESEKNDSHVICKKSSVSDEVTLLFGGDICFDDNYSNMNTFRAQKNGISGVLSSELMSELQGADITMLNNEFPYSNRGTPTMGKTFTFRANPERVSILTDMGVDIVSLANNHAYDHGPDALLDTFSTLNGVSIPYVGAGKNLEEAMKPTYFISGGMKIAYVSATQIERLDNPDTKEATSDSPGVLRTLVPDKFLTVIKEAKENSDFVVVYVHWGSENVYEADASQKALASQFEEAGADLIVGDHSHCLQGIEFVNDTPVIYSLGNFWFNSKNLDTGFIKVKVQKSGMKSYQFIPCLQHVCKTDQMLPNTNGEYERILGVMAGLSSDISIDPSGYVTKGAGNGVNAVSPRALTKPAANSANAVLTVSPDSPM
ncbi:MAG: CapA family protein [Lachnospiraceae bacterium]|nr:CapA family protein [Lachnospiraceae bacterium]